jgi:acetyltransferase-like isoleucine patch superfamily enzyme
MLGRIIGTLPETCGLTAEYFLERDCYVDARGIGKLIISSESMFGWGVKIITASHEIFSGRFETVGRNVVVERKAWIASFAILYNCTIGEGAIVAIGSVVSNQVVEPFTIVEGNPARPIARMIDGRWRKIHE